MPRKSTGAPTASPRSDWLKSITTCSGGPSGSRIASVSSEARRNVVLLGAVAPAVWFGGVWNAMPPRITVASDCVFSFSPLESSRRSTPLACHQREFSPTYWSYGAFTNTLKVTPVPSLSSEKPTTWPTCTRR